jgi:hypothetical protein
LQYIWIMYLFQGRNKLGATKFFSGLPWPALVNYRARTHPAG